MLVDYSIKPNILTVLWEGVLFKIILLVRVMSKELFENDFKARKPCSREKRYYQIILDE